MPYGYAYFFVANSRVKITKGNPLWLCTAGETTAKLLTMMNIVLFSCETELLFGNLKIVLPLVHSFFDFSFLVSKNWVKEV